MDGWNGQDLRLYGTSIHSTTHPPNHSLPPLDEKRKVHANALNRGYTPFEEETLDPAGQSKGPSLSTHSPTHPPTHPGSSFQPPSPPPPGDTKEGYYIGREISASSEEAQLFPLHGPNQWPDPLLLPEWRKTMERYFSALQVSGWVGGWVDELFPRYGPKQWPESSLLPEWRKTIEAYFSALQVSNPPTHSPTHPLTQP